MLVYVSHSFHEFPERDPRLHRWLRWCVESTSPNVSFVLGVTRAEDMPTIDHAIRAARGNLDLLARCDVMVMLGQMSSRMAVEREAAQRLGLTVVDLTRFPTAEPPAQKSPEEFFSLYEPRSAVA